jgi:hypothetical protein
LNGKLLLLGESHYWADTPESTFTRRLTDTYCKYERSDSYWTNLMQVVSGKHHSTMERSDFWAKVAFYNYIQESLDEPRLAPDAEMWNLAKKPFLEVHSQLLPDRILIISYRLWDEFDFGGSPCGSVKANDIEMPLWKIEINNKTSICGCIRHPSSGFSSEQWQPVVKEFLNCTM